MQIARVQPHVRDPAWPPPPRALCLPGEALPLAASNQVLLQFSARSGASARGFHLLYQGKCLGATDAPPAPATAGKCPSCSVRLLRNGGDSLTHKIMP